MAPRVRTKPTARPASPIAVLTESARRGDLVAIIGSGVSMGLTNNENPALSWKGLIEHGLAYCLSSGLITKAEASWGKKGLQKKSLDLMLLVAELVTRKLQASTGDLYMGWMRGVFGSIGPTNTELSGALQALVKAGIPLCTLNYDSLLEQVTQLPTIEIGQTDLVLKWLRYQHPGILHLHGWYEAPKTCILGIRDYAETQGNEVRQFFQRSLTATRRLLFIGCGDTFADPNFSVLIRWLRQNLEAGAPKHYALVREGDVAARARDASWLGFVEPLSYGADYPELPAFLLKHFPPTAPTREGARPRGYGSVSSHDKLIRDYCEFLVRDCGQMSIDGVNADMETAQRRFDIERLFIPLKVIACTEQQQIGSMEVPRSLTIDFGGFPMAFGEVFQQHQRLALLALPGGGKTLLLKRLAVAYADPARRRASSDTLPDIELVPVLIRCREWRAHIHLPIATLLRSVPDIIGQPALEGLSEALRARFDSGQILLLVDGLDEIHDDALRSTFVNNLEAFLREQPQIRLVVTSREAGFSLVAPAISRFCQRFRVAPLDDEAIVALCEQWHVLMRGESESVPTEGREVAMQIQRQDPLRRLAENPLLLTMLLVVRHKSDGRLPPDRVTLYSRAIEVLLDTWNIQGHAPLILTESEPQLSYVAFQMMRLGKQTATEKELLELIIEARRQVPHIQHHATDTPHRFLKRVELRSSLLVEAGHQIELGRVVSFYQFRHLTFQEYLAAVAAFEGYYPNYDSHDTLVKPLGPYLFADEWKQVVPMAAVLAKQQAEPLMAALLQPCAQLRQQLESGESSTAIEEWQRDFPMALPTEVERLLQCLVEGSSATPVTLEEALQAVALFAAGAHSNHDWTGLSRGPYRNLLIQQTWRLFAPMTWPPASSLDETYLAFVGRSNPDRDTSSAEGQAQMLRRLDSPNLEEIAQGLAGCTYLMRLQRERKVPLADCDLLLPHVEKHLFLDDQAILLLAATAWSELHPLFGVQKQPSTKTLDRLLRILLTAKHPRVRRSVALALFSRLGMQRGSWQPKLTAAEAQQLRNEAATWDGVSLTSLLTLFGIYTIAYHARNIWSDAKLRSQLTQVRKRMLDPSLAEYKSAIDGALEQLARPEKNPRKAK